MKKAAFSILRKTALLLVKIGSIHLTISFGKLHPKNKSMRNVSKIWYIHVLKGIMQQYWHMDKQVAGKHLRWGHLQLGSLVLKIMNNRLG